MLKHLLLTGATVLATWAGSLGAHCQMPCGIYHDDMVYDQIDQYVETMYKGISILKENKRDTDRERNEFIRWVILKEKASDEAASLLTTYFLQQKIKPDEQDTAKRLSTVHKLLVDLVLIKQNVDLKFVEAFAKDWDNFKLMFHVEGYECKIEQLKMKKREELEKKQSDKDSHSNDHDHGHDHDSDHDHDHNHSH